ncbi:MAG: RidA family protein [Acidimicrobiia bacterium]
MPAQLIQSSAPRPLASYSEAFKVGNLVFAAGQLASDFKTGVPPEASINKAFPFYGSEIKQQTRYILDNLRSTFEAAGSSLANIVKAQVFMTDMRDFNAFDEVWREYFGDAVPARTTVGTTELLGAGPPQLLEVDLIGHTGDVEHQVVVSGGPRPLANYTEAIRVGNLVLAAGQIANDFVTGVPPEARTHPDFPYYGSDIKLQTRYILENLKTTFATADSSLGNVVKAQVFLRDLMDFNAFDEVWKEYFADSPPPRTTVGITELLGSGPEQLLEIDLIAHSNGVTKQVVQSDNPRPLAVYSEAVVVDGLVFAAGQLASDFRTGVPEEARANPAFPYYGSDIKAQARYVLDNCRRTFEAAGSSLDNVFKAQVFMTDMRNFNAFDEVWKEYFKVPPARTTVGTTGLLVKDALVEIDLIGSVE